MDEALVEREEGTFAREKNQMLIPESYDRGFASIIPSASFRNRR
jgi:hypothetical protein